MLPAAGRLVVHKPDLPPSFGPPAPASRLGGVGPLPVGLSPRASRGASAAALRDYSGPNAFAIPGNHGERSMQEACSVLHMLKAVGCVMCEQQVAMTPALHCCLPVMTQ